MTSMGEPAKKSTLYALVDALPDGEIAAAERYLEFLSQYAEADAPVSDGERARLREVLKRGITSARAGETRPVDEFLSEFSEP